MSDAPELTTHATEIPFPEMADPTTLEDPMDLDTVDPAPAGGAVISLRRIPGTLRDQTGRLGNKRKHQKGGKQSKPRKKAKGGSSPKGAEEIEAEGSEDDDGSDDAGEIELEDSTSEEEEEETPPETVRRFGSDIAGQLRLSKPIRLPGMGDYEWERVKNIHKNSQLMNSIPALPIEIEKPIKKAKQRRREIDADDSLRAERHILTRGMHISIITFFSMIIIRLGARNKADQAPQIPQARARTKNTSQKPSEPTPVVSASPTATAEPDGLTNTILPQTEAVAILDGRANRRTGSGSADWLAKVVTYLTSGNGNATWHELLVLWQRFESLKNYEVC